MQLTYPQLSKEIAENEVAVEMVTNRGTIKLKLFPEIAPKAVENFVTHAKNGYYDDLIFHRVIPEFMIQGGDPQGQGYGGESIWGDPFEDEFSPYAFNIRGALSMANAGPNTNGSQFFIVQKPDMPEDMIEQMKEAGFPSEIIEAYKTGGTPWLDGRHTVFGHVVEGLDVVDTIASVPTVGQDKPANDVVIEKVIVK